MGKQTARANLTIPGAIAMILAAAGASAQQAPQPEKAVLGEIIVTAQKRAESVRDVPSAVSVVSRAQLENFHVTQLSDIAGYVPGLRSLRMARPGNSPFRCAASPRSRRGADVATYVDETPLGSQWHFQRETQFQLDLLPYDVEQIEVLRGPQGTLYGAGAMGGLLKYVTRSPRPDGLRIPRRCGHVRCRRGGRFRQAL